MNTIAVWILIAIAPDARIDFVQAFSMTNAQQVCKQEAKRLRLESRKFLPQPYSYACIPAGGFEGSQ